MPNSNQYIAFEIGRKRSS